VSRKNRQESDWLVKVRCAKPGDPPLPIGPAMPEDDEASSEPTPPEKPAPRGAKQPVPE
jgi:hypothetical protein